jgi:hypothetical protein
MNILRWKAENCPFEEDWGDREQYKWALYFDWDIPKFRIAEWYIHQYQQTGAIYFATQEDAEACLKACEADWYTYFGVKR